MTVQEYVDQMDAEDAIYENAVAIQQSILDREYEHQCRLEQKRIKAYWENQQIIGGTLPNICDYTNC